jgi:predicted Co/Zn/Cd cation transporter (cation efflux family)
MKADLKKNDPLFYRVRSDADGAEVTRHEARMEKHLLRFSVYAALFFAVLGLAWGVLIKSQMLIFDGIYSFVSVLMTSLSVYVAGIMGNKDDAKFPFGRSQMEPMVIILRALLIIVVCASAFGRAMVWLVSGGGETNVFSAMIYCLLGTVGCLGCWLYITRQRRKVRLSGLVQAESMQWLADTLLSLTIFLGFLAACMLKHTEHAQYVRYIDPLMVMIAAVFFSSAPVVSFVGGIKDILRMAPDGDIYRVSRPVLEEIAKKRGFDGFVLRIAKSGRDLVYEIGFVSDDPKDARSMGELDDIRNEVESRLKALFENQVWLDISFMHDKKWG